MKSRLHKRCLMASVEALTPQGIIAARGGDDVDAQIRRLARRSFTTGAIAALAGGSAVTWLATRPTDSGIPWPLRRALQFNERLAQSLFDSSRLAPQFPVECAIEPRVNGHVGLRTRADAAGWMLHVVGKADQHDPLTAIQTLPSYEMTTQLKCVEGWSSIVRWKGVRLADFLSKFGTSSDYIGISTPPDGTDSQGRP